MAYLDKISDRTRARALAALTSDAYSVDRYASWPACAEALVKMGFNDLEVMAILRSSWMRHADEGNARYGRYPASVIVNSLKRMASNGRGMAYVHREVKILTRATFEGYFEEESQ